MDILSLTLIKIYSYHLMSGILIYATQLSAFFSYLSEFFYALCEQNSFAVGCQELVVSYHYHYHPCSHSCEQYLNFYSLV